LLGSIIRQLINQQTDIPEDVRELYHEHTRDGLQPNLAEFSKLLRSITSHFSRVYIIVDALDECNEIEKTGSFLLEQLQGLKPHVQLFLTSRPHEEHISSAVEFKVAAQEDDIRKYLSAQISQTSNLASPCTEDERLREDIIDKIIKQSGEMLVYKLYPLAPISYKCWY
jgi:hypothetical protein